MNESNDTPHVRVMSDDHAAMQRITEIGLMPMRQRIAAMAEWQAEQEAAR